MKAGHGLPWVSLSKIERHLGIGREELRDLVAHAGEFYKPFDQRKQGSTKWRHIDNPREPLKGIQGKILGQLLRPVKLPETMMGGVRGRSILDNADLHLGKPCLVTMDLRDCFPTIDPKRVFSVYRNVVGCGDEVASVLTRLTTFQNRLPQGAPTSPTLANMALLPLHEEIQRVARKYDLVCSFYVDDIAFSGRRAREVIDVMVDLVQKHGFSISHQKLSVMPRHDRQEVPGVIVNAVRSAGRERLERIRRSIYQLGAQEHAPYERELKRLRGQISYVKSVNLVQGMMLERYAERHLPSAGVEGGDDVKPLTRICRCANRHRRKPKLDQGVES